MITSNFQSVVSKACGATVVVLGLNLISTNANALDLVGTSGQFSNNVGGSSVEYSSDGSEVRWGSGTGSQSGLRFIGVGGTASLPNDTPFLLGTLQHFNNPIFGAISSVDLAIALDFGIDTPIFNFTFAVDETPNSGVCVYPSTRPCADKITWANAFSNQTFFENGTEYTLELTGFDGGLSQFISQERETNSAQLYGQITRATDVVPTPAAILPVLMGMFGAASRKRNQAKNIQDV
ncbi:MAG: PTPA-CTERM sorting domain-containing protein [Limnothrix sp. RL_2_0]|nr:PTPA-CTERM sorting domain-containing protein [Limnothrix sp. RL_2_0]